MTANFLRPGFSQRAICILLAMSMAASPSMNVLAQTGGAEQPAPAATQPAADAATAKIDTKYVMPGTVALAVLRPAQIMKSPMSELLPTEVATAAGIKYLGMDPAQVEEVIGFIDMSNPTMPNYGVTFKFVEPLKNLALPQELRAHTQPDELNGRRYLKSQDPMAPSFYAPDKQTLLVAPDETIKKLIQSPAPAKPGPFFDRVHKVAGGNDLYIAVDLVALRPFIQMGLMQAQREMPPDALPFVEGVKLLAAAELTFNLSKPAPSSLLVHANDEAAAKEIEKLIADAMEKAREQMRADMAQQAASDDPVERAFAQYMERVSGRFAQPFLPKREGTTMVVFRVQPGTGPEQQLTTVAIVGILVALLLPAVQAAREAARRNQSMNNLKQMMLALLNHESAKREFPAHAIYSEDGKPLLSWRIKILPYIEEQALYEQFHLDEPWDSEHNRALIPRMPQVFANPNLKLEPGKTNYLGVVGKECFFNGTEKGVKIREITDGTSKTIALVEADPDKAVEWTKPDDFHVDPNNPSAGLGHLRPGGWIAGFCDGSVQFINNGVDQGVLQALFTIAGGEVVDRP
jgi:hypothetical protein